MDWCSKTEESNQNALTLALALASFSLLSTATLSSWIDGFATCWLEDFFATAVEDDILQLVWLCYYDLKCEQSSMDSLLAV